jgi:hypothetical protein
MVKCSFQTLDDKGGCERCVELGFKCSGPKPPTSRQGVRNRSKEEGHLKLFEDIIEEAGQEYFKNLSNKALKRSNQSRAETQAPSFPLQGIRKSGLSIALTGRKASTRSKTH